jgi:hypothetical protein
MESSGMDGPAATESASTTTEATTTAAAPGQRVIGYQGCADNDDRCQNDKTVTKHGIPP